MHFSQSLCLSFIGASIAHSVAVPAPVVEADSRAASCTFTDAASATKGKSSCATVTLSGIAVPAGQTLDLTGLAKGTHV